MPLRMTVISVHRESLGGAYTQDFSLDGGTIGRSLECYWPLPDAKRYVSSRHARIDYQAGCYYLVDMSRNGVYVNDSDTPVGKGKPQRLFDGDRIRIGEYEMECAILEERTADQAQAMADSVVRAQQVPVDENTDVSLLEPEQLNDDLSLEILLSSGATSTSLSAGDSAPTAISRQNLLRIITREVLLSAGLSPADFEDVDPSTLLRKMGASLRRDPEFSQTPTPVTEETEI